jgi:hypothetical protein
VVVQGVQRCPGCRCRLSALKASVYALPGLGLLYHIYIMRRWDPMTRGTVMRLLGMELLLLFR